MTIETFHFSTKAETLARVKPLLRQANVLDLVYFSVSSWRLESAQWIAKIQSAFNGCMLVVRSSAANEDHDQHSMAGAYLSCVGVDGQNVDAIKSAIDSVIASYSQHSDPARDQVLIQPMLHNVAICGVLMTHELQQGAPYLVLDYDDVSGKTDTITGGKGAHKTVMVYRGQLDAAETMRYVQSPRIGRILQLGYELEALSGGVPIDMEFALTQDDALYLLQVRRVSVAKNWHPGTAVRVARQLDFVRQFFEEVTLPQPGIFGKRTVLASMSDWNPAEIIGTAPRPLAASLYQHLFTHDVWRDARQLMGYRKLPQIDLMYLVAARPYIDTRHSFNSFLPEGIDPVIGTRLVDAWTDRLCRSPELHDKIEFDIATTCYDFSFRKNFIDRYPQLLSADELSNFESVIKHHTLSALQLDVGGSLSIAESCINQLAALQQRPILPGRSLRTATQLLAECRQLGTLPFAVIARHAFIAEALLRSLVDRGVLTPQRLASLRQSIPTITRRLTDDFSATVQQKLDAASFLSRYGHLRPGTYDITSLRYDERTDLFDHNQVAALPVSTETFEFSAQESATLDQLIQHELNGCVDHQTLMGYAKRAIAGREYAKFIFTRHLSDALAIIGRWGESVGLDRTDLSYVPWPVLDQLSTWAALDYPDRVLLAEVSKQHQYMSHAQLIKLAHLIRGAEDIYVVPQHRSAPNFITQYFVDAKTVYLSADSVAHTTIQGCIVCIESADPGFDWIFTKGIAGLVTQYGGPNSHMAIRCSEFGLPAAIGCGEVTFCQIKQAARVELNCREKIIRPVV